MSEADKQTNSSFSELINFISSMPATQVNVNYTDSPGEQLISADSRYYAPSLVPASENLSTVNLAVLSSCIEATENGLASFKASELAKLFSLIQELRCSNSNLLNRVLQLEQKLNDCQDNLDWYKQRASVAESMLTQQTQELVADQEQVSYLLQQLETAHQTTERQQILIETLTAEVESSQERAAQMERDCARTQASYNEQSHRLMQTENTCRELRNRLNRQQRHTMQLKVALEKCLEVPVASPQSEFNINSIPTDTPSWQTGLIQAQSLFPKAEPIQPWSVQPHFSDELGSTETESSVFVGVNLTDQAVGQQTTSTNQFVDFSVDRGQPTHFEPTPSPEPFELPITRATAQIYLSDFSEADDAEWQNLLNLLDEAGEETGTDNLANNSLEAATILSTPDVNQANPNWPSPVVYPLHPPKRRTSLSAVELPTFAQKRG
jgi:hypothetical protein